MLFFSIKIQQNNISGFTCFSIYVLLILFFLIIFVIDYIYRADKTAPHRFHTRAFTIPHARVTWPHGRVAWLDRKLDIVLIPRRTGRHRRPAWDFLHQQHQQKHLPPAWLASEISNVFTMNTANQITSSSFHLSSAFCADVQLQRRRHRLCEWDCSRHGDGGPIVPCVGIICSCYGDILLCGSLVIGHRLFSGSNRRRRNGIATTACYDSFTKVCTSSWKPQSTCTSPSPVEFS